MWRDVVLYICRKWETIIEGAREAFDWPHSDILNALVFQEKVNKGNHVQHICMVLKNSKD